MEPGNCQKSTQKLLNLFISLNRHAWLPLFPSPSWWGESQLPFRDSSPGWKVQLQARRGRQFVGAINLSGKFEYAVNAAGTGPTVLVICRLIWMDPSSLPDAMPRGHLPEFIRSLHDMKQTFNSWKNSEENNGGRFMRYKAHTFKYVNNTESFQSDCSTIQRSEVVGPLCSSITGLRCDDCEKGVVVDKRPVIIVEPRSCCLRRLCCFPASGRLTAYFEKRLYPSVFRRVVCSCLTQGCVCFRHREC